MECYGPIVNLINSEKLWHSTKREDMLPLRHRRPLGRPRTLRKGEPDKPRLAHKLKRVGIGLKCLKCQKYGCI